MGNGGGGVLRTSVFDFSLHCSGSNPARSFMLNRTAQPHFKIALLGHNSQFLELILTHVRPRALPQAQRCSNRPPRSEKMNRTLRWRQRKCLPPRRRPGVRAGRSWSAPPRRPWPWPRPGPLRPLAYRPRRARSGLVTSAPTEAALPRRSRRRRCTGRTMTGS